MDRYKIIVAGGRDFSNQDLVDRTLDYLLDFTGEHIEIVCGMAKGADTSGLLWAKANNKPVAEFTADWNQFGKGAGYKRNAEMADYADLLIAFWDGKSRGTKHMIDLAKKKGISYGVLGYEGQLIEWDVVIP